MDPHEFARQQGQVAGSGGNPPDADPADAEDLMYLLLDAYAAAGHMIGLSHEEHASVARFAEFSNSYLVEHRVISTGVVDGEFSLVFEGGRTVPLASTEPVPARPDGTVPITHSRDTKMKGMPVVDNSVPVTTGKIGSPTRHPSGS